VKVLLLDNYDSFTFNLFHLLEQIGQTTVDVRRNDDITLSQAGQYDRIVISPGPGIPSEAGIMMDLIRHYQNTIPILGVCLGLQGIAESCGGSILNGEQVHHGIARTTLVIDREEPLFKGMPRSFLTGRYHSWSVDMDSLPPELRITAVDEDGVIMALSHDNRLLKGVQFHPESILTEYGKELISNWLTYC
jgi:anthranilate synthase component II